MERFTDISLVALPPQRDPKTELFVTAPNGFEGRDGGGLFSARFDLFLIQQAWVRGCSFEAQADGFGKGMGTMQGDWSGIRDSTPKATVTMLQKALNYLFGMPASKGVRR